MSPSEAWPHWKEPTVERDPVFSLFGAPWAGWLEDTMAVSFMGFKFPSRFMNWPYRDPNGLKCYRHKANFLAEQDSRRPLTHLGSIASMGDAWGKFLRLQII
eukprot:5250716-Prymnesium_polylepis.2